METAVKVKLKTVIQQSGEQPEMYELWSRGTSRRRGDSLYLQYEEIQDEKAIKTTLKIKQSEALILRSGGVNMRLAFTKGAEQTGSYESEYGTLMVKTKTKQLEQRDTEHGGEIDISYDLIVGGQHVGFYTLEFTYTEETI
ncbi:DUF1934 domain-containing protein [Paenisporosarcina cavernae]|uniref:DUF1934 domain-containing protein n=1 Tax=Paenisporosarcina cavernae TaxID=2320858 RepID=A0A385YQM6_9BACL|nr:DUF1934 domain-containing protein [Paenisporosarcina cavernae]AYC28794.1 DUF1934 domain-containing protein [Paenisporosarcina cavernae]